MYVYIILHQPIRLLLSYRSKEVKGGDKQKKGRGGKCRQGHTFIPHQPNPPSATACPMHTHKQTCMLTHVQTDKLPYKHVYIPTCM